MVMVTNKDSSKQRAEQVFREATRDPNKIGASTPFDFTAKNLTPYGGLLPVATMLENLGFQSLVEGEVTLARQTKVMSMYQFVLAMVLGIYVGFARLYQLRFIARDPILAGILKIQQLPGQSTFWRFLASLHVNVQDQILSIQRQMRERVLGSGERGIGGGNAGYGYDGAHAVRKPDGSAQELQPEEQGEEELSTDPDL